MECVLSVETCRIVSCVKVVHLKFLYVLYINLEMLSTMKFFVSLHFRDVLKLI